VEMRVGVEFTGRECTILKSLVQEVLNKGPIENPNLEHVEIINRKTREGFCYHSLLFLLPNISTASPQRVERLIQILEEKLGESPEGKDVLTELPFAELALQVSVPIDEVYGNLMTLMNLGGSVRIFEEMMANTSIRYTVDESGGLFHVERVPGECDCKDILCDHGWAARFVLTAISSAGRRVGAHHSNIDFSALFVEKESTDGKPIMPGDEDQESFFTVNELKIREKDRQAREIERKNLDVEMSSVLGSHLERRTQMIEEALKNLLAERDLTQKLNQSKQKTLDSEDEDCVETIRPCDSSSVIERYTDGRRFMQHSSAYTYRDNKTHLEPVVENQVVLPERVVVQGFVKTKLMEEKEKESHDRVYTINGLAAPFRNSRLNFLTHVNTALVECSFDPMSDPIDALEEIGTVKPKNPTGELVRQVVQRTFDFDQLSVIANPFKLPFIEVGMPITDSVVLKSLELLQLEHKSLWFSEMKCLRVPKFFDDFTGVSTEVSRSGVKDGTRRHRRPSRTGREEHVEQSRQGTSEKRFQRRSATVLGIKI